MAPNFRVCTMMMNPAMMIDWNWAEELQIEPILRRFKKNSTSSKKPAISLITIACKLNGLSVEPPSKPWIYPSQSQQHNYIHL